MIVARDMMTDTIQCIGEAETLTAAAQKMADCKIGALPICGSDGNLMGMITDRDIVVKCLATGADPATVCARELAQGKCVTIGADSPMDEIIRMMSDHPYRRMPVMDGTRLVGMISRADIARHMPPPAMETMAATMTMQ
jgi:CBS domain-containing protein